MTSLTTSEAAVRLGISRARVRQLIAAGRLSAIRHGRDWSIRPHDLKLIAIRKPGRPRKQG